MGRGDRKRARDCDAKCCSDLRELGDVALETFAATASVLTCSVAASGASSLSPGTR